MDISSFNALIKSKRQEIILSPKEITYSNFVKNNFHIEDADFFFLNASVVVEILRADNWESFRSFEKELSSEMYKNLIDEESIKGFTVHEGLDWFFTTYPEHIYALNLSNTQSRRSRAGKEFEYIIELLLMGAEIPFDTQASVASGVFASENLPKIVDCVSPGAIEYKINKRNTSLISAKTTLRERWQEVGDEMARSLANEMYLATLDEDISENTINLICQNNIVLVTTVKIKSEKYQENSKVLTFEDMIRELSQMSDKWETKTYNDQQLQSKLNHLHGLKSNSSSQFEEIYYEKLIKKFNR